MLIYTILFVETVLIACYFFFFFFNDTATTEIYTLSLHDALPIFQPRNPVPGPRRRLLRQPGQHPPPGPRPAKARQRAGDRKSTRLNSSHGYISYAVFCLKKKNEQTNCTAQHMPKRSVNNAHYVHG